MKYEYDITRHPAEAFNALTFYCSESGECSIDDVPHEQTDVLRKILNERGWDGWELIQVAFGKDGLIAFWKRPADEVKY